MGADSWLITLPEHDSSPGSVRPPSPSCLSSSIGRNYVADAHPSFILVVKLPEPAREEIMTTVCSATFQGCGCLAWALWWVIEKRAWKQLEENWGSGFVHCTIPISRIFGWPPCAISCIVITSMDAGTLWKQGIIAGIYWFLVDVK